MGRCRNVVFYSFLHSQCLRCLCCLSEEYKEQTAKENSDNAGQPALFNYRLRYIRFTIFVLTPLADKGHITRFKSRMIMGGENIIALGKEKTWTAHGFC